MVIAFDHQRELFVDPFPADLVLQGRHHLLVVNSDRDLGQDLQVEASSEADRPEDSERVVLESSQRVERRARETVGQVLHAEAGQVFYFVLVDVVEETVYCQVSS